MRNAAACGDWGRRRLGLGKETDKAESIIRYPDTTKKETEKES